MPFARASGHAGRQFAKPSAPTLGVLEPCQRGRNDLELHVGYMVSGRDGACGVTKVAEAPPGLAIAFGWRGFRDGKRGRQYDSIT